MALEVGKVVTLRRQRRIWKGREEGLLGWGVSHVLFLHLGAGYMRMFIVKIRVVKLCALLCM